MSFIAFIYGLTLAIYGLGADHNHFFIVGTIVMWMGILKD